MTNLHEKTRDIYHQQHMRLANDEDARSRIHAMYSREYFGTDFTGLSALDVGCGDTAVLLIRLAQLGATNLAGCDIGDNWIPTAQRELDREGVKADLKPGNVLELDYEDRSFDLVACNGVLLHLADMDEVEHGFAECARIAKRYLYTTYATGVGGLIESAIIPAVRDYYHRNPEFKSLIDNIGPAVFRSTFNKISTDMRKHTGESAFIPNAVADLFDEDLCVFLQNAIQPPSRLGEQCTAERISELYRQHGFAPRRLSRYVKRKNFRKFFAPLHYDKADVISRVLYGDGSVEFIGERVG